VFLRGHSRPHPKGTGPRGPPYFWTIHARRQLDDNNQILHGDQTIDTIDMKKTFYRVDHERLTRCLFAVVNMPFLLPLIATRDVDWCEKVRITPYCFIYAGSGGRFQGGHLTTTIEVEKSKTKQMKGSSLKSICVARN